MKFNRLQYLFFIGLGIVLYVSMSSYSNTVTGFVMDNHSQSGCNCHGPSNVNTTITVLGLPKPSEGYIMGKTYPVNVIVKNTSKLKSGINISVNTGRITNCGTGLQLENANNVKSARHSAPMPLNAGESIYTFDWVAPSTNSNTLQFFASAVAADGSGTLQNDAWNTYTMNVPLNIDYLSFNVSSKPNQIHLYWKTITEDKIKHFVIEKSEDGIVFDSVNVVIANGAIGVGRSYDFYDYPPYSGDYFYRLKIVDDNQNTAYSQVQKVAFDNGASLESFSYPNPSAAQQSININVFNNKSKTLLVTMTDINGFEVYRFNYAAVKGTNYLLIPKILASGLYKITITPEVGKVINMKHVIN